MPRIRNTSPGGRTKARAAARGSEKHIAPLVPGVALKYPLSGLVVCGLCGLSMSPSSSPEYTTKGTGEIKPELHASMVELGTPICPTVADAREELIKQRSFIARLAHDRDVAVVAAGS